MSVVRRHLVVRGGVSRVVAVMAVAVVRVMSMVVTMVVFVVSRSISRAGNASRPENESARSNSNRQ